MRVNVRQYLKKRGRFRNEKILADAVEARTLSGGNRVSNLLRMSDERINEIVQMVRRVRHDANNPLTAALGHVQLLLDDPAVTDPEVIDSLKVVESELRRLTDILRQLNEIKTM
jgi:signal transduction histidine kinase